jgi:superfamily II DNA or RNA helicase
MTTNTSVNNKSIIRSGMLTRKTTHMFKYLSSVQKLNDDLQEEAHKDWLHTVQDTKAVLSSLRSREINLLFATSVVEEGVDIDACSFVIILDELQTIKTYVQTKGRARQLDANFYVFENTHVDSQRPPLTLSDANSIDLKVSSYLGSRKEVLINDDMDSLTTTFFQEKLLTNYTPELSTLSRLEEEAVINRMYRTSNGMVDLASSKSLVNRYCSCIPMDLQ